MSQCKVFVIKKNELLHLFWKQVNNLLDYIRQVLVSTDILMSKSIGRIYFYHLDTICIIPKTI